MSVLVDCPHCSTRVLPMEGRTCPACRSDLDAPPRPGPTSVRSVEDAYGLAASRMQAGADRAEVERSLTERGLDSRTAAEVAGNLERARSNANGPEQARNDMIVGGLFCLGGLAVTAMTYRMASGPGGGKFVLAWGAILFGGIRFIRGLIRSSG